MIKLKINMTTNPNYYSKTMVVQCLKLKLKIFAKRLEVIKKCLISVLIQLNQNTIIIRKN